VLITFEGIDGCGKSTQINKLSAWLKRQGIAHHLFREPGGTDLSESVRELLLHSAGRMDPVTEMLLFSAARSQLVAEKVIPLLERGDLVILDRFFDSTTAYQGYGRGSASPEDIRQLNRLAAHDIQPDCTFYIRVPVELARKRRAGQKEDRMEQETDRFFQRVADGFELLVANDDRFVALDGTRSPEAIHEEVVARVKILAGHV